MFFRRVDLGSANPALCRAGSELSGIQVAFGVATENN